MKRIVLLGATGSIGDSTLRVIAAHPEQLRLVAVAANSNSDKLLQIARDHPSVRHVALCDETADAAARDNLPPGVALHAGPAGLRELAVLPEADVVLVAIVGTAGLLPALDALAARKDLALASKEILVLAGDLVMDTAARSGARLLPVDSEHNAVFQCLQGHPPAHVCRVHLTASGGALRDWPLERLRHATPADVLKHPNWSMGPKITTDSATLANKGLELIEAQKLFGLKPSQLAAVLHPQSVVHALVEFTDGSTLAQLCPPSMTFPIQHALLHPERSGSPALPPLDVARLGTLAFAPVDETRYPMLRLAREVMNAGGTAPAIYNAANEAAVAAFLADKLPFHRIAEITETTLREVPVTHTRSLDEILETDLRARRVAAAHIAANYV
ncbi:MAG: 1-deoxy-D-xylulose-5-phosphate reductoisomerase [Opitutaceae bacterium]|jgi:1-deoxy-D-xylulose-5-phosphate reductoisomerase|nr:1-deoxy-D-xylulose-5-phosphate reductoisomerase [Opitutaceae bacterium]